MKPSGAEEQYCVRIGGETLGFSAAHFITLDDGESEPLHGHDYRVVAEIAGPLGPHQYVVDFLAVERVLKDILLAWDHRTLLPERHPAFRIDVRAGEIEVSLGPRRWVLPRADCVLLPVANTTAEALAGHLAARLLAELAAQEPRGFGSVRVELFESPGFSAVCTLRSSRSDPPS